MRKKVSSLILLLIAVCIGLSQAQSLRIHLKNGETLTYGCADIDSLVFDAPQTPDGPTFKLEYSDLTTTTVTLKVTPSDNNIRYYFDLLTPDQLQSTPGGIPTVVEEYISQLAEEYPMISFPEILNVLLSQGPDEDNLTKLPAGTDFIFYAIAVDDNGKCYGQPTTTTFSTPAGGDPADCSFEINYANLSTDGLTIKVTPSDPTVRYWMGITEAAGYPGDIAMFMDVKASIEEAAVQNSMTVSEVVSRVTYTADATIEESGLSPDTEYYIYVYAMSETGENAGNMYKKKFATRLTGYSDADISLQYRYFNGNDLYNSDPETYAILKDRVFVQIAVTPNEYAANWAVGLVAGDYTDEITYPEEPTKNALLQGGFLNVTSKNIISDWTTATFLYFAADEAGVDGPLKRLPVTFTPENARPISELQSDGTQNADVSVSRLGKPAPRQKTSTLPERLRRNPGKNIYRLHF